MLSDFEAPLWLRPALQRAKLFQAHVKATIDSGPPKVHGFAGLVKIQQDHSVQNLGEDFGILIQECSGYIIKGITRDVATATELSQSTIESERGMLRAIYGYSM